MLNLPLYGKMEKLSFFFLYHMNTYHQKMACMESYISLLSTYYIAQISYCRERIFFLCC